MAPNEELDTFFATWNEPDSDEILSDFLRLIFARPFGPSLSMVAEGVALAVL